MSSVPATSSIGEKLLGERRSRGMSQAQLAAELQTTAQTVARWEAGGEPQIRWRAKIERFLNPPSPLLFPVADAALANADERPLTPMQEVQLNAFAARVSSGVPLNPGEIQAFRTSFQAVGLRWPSA